MTLHSQSQEKFPMDPTNETSKTTDLVEDILDYIGIYMCPMSEDYRKFVREDLQEILDKYDI